MNETNIHPINHRHISRTEKETLFGHLGSVFWLYGLSGSGKSTLALEIEKHLHDRGTHSVLLDGDNLRCGLNQDLGFSDQDRKENIRRVSEVAKILLENGVIVLVSLITPLREFRDLAKSIIGENNFHEIFINASFSACKKRDVKGIYAKADQGLVNDFTGKDSNFEEPINDCLIIDSENETPQQSVETLLKYILHSISLDK